MGNGEGSVGEYVTSPVRLALLCFLWDGGYGGWESGLGCRLGWERWEFACLLLGLFA